MQLTLITKRWPVSGHGQVAGEGAGQEPAADASGTLAPRGDLSNEFGLSRFPPGRQLRQFFRRDGVVSRELHVVS